MMPEAPHPWRKGWRMHRKHVTRRYVRRIRTQAVRGMT